MSEAGVKRSISIRRRWRGFWFVLLASGPLSILLGVAAEAQGVWAQPWLMLGQVLLWMIALAGCWTARCPQCKGYCFQNGEKFDLPYRCYCVQCGAEI